MDILKSYSDEKICAMQKNALQFYNDYVKDSKGRLRGILKVLDGRLNKSGGNQTFTVVPGGVMKPFFFKVLD
jgi:hypothetical protein